MTYLPNDPGTHCVGSARQLLQGHQKAIDTTALLLPLGCALGLAVVEVCARRELRLARLGEVAPGRILDKRRGNNEGQKTYWVHYQIDTPDGVGRTGWAAVGPVLWEALRTGSPLTVVYDPDNPRHHRPTFSFRWVRFTW